MRKKFSCTVSYTIAPFSQAKSLRKRYLDGSLPQDRITQLEQLGFRYIGFEWSRADKKRKPQKK